MKIIFRHWLIVLLGLTVSLARAAETPNQTVLRLDQARLAAMMAGDGAALAKLMSDDLSFVHSDGRIESKADYVKNVLAGDTAFEDVKTPGPLQTKEIAPGVIVLIGSQEMRKRLGPTWSEIKLKFLAVWRNEGGTWRMVAWQSMKPSGNSVLPGK